MASRVHPDPLSGQGTEASLITQHSQSLPPLDLNQYRPETGVVPAPHGKEVPRASVAESPSDGSASLEAPGVTAATGPDEEHTQQLQTTSHRAWRMLGKVTVFARSVNNHDDSIDIYHSSRAGVGQYMIHPNSKFRRMWDISTATCVLYVCVMVPLSIGFGFVDWGNRYIIDTMIDIYFIIDMVMTMRTGIFSNGEVIMDSRAVMRKYVRTWLIIDVLSNFPLQLFVSTSARKSIKMVKLQKLPKLLRFGRLLKYLREYAKYYNLALSFVALVMLLHLFACLWASVFNVCFAPDETVLCVNSDMGTMYIESIHTVMLMFLGIADSSSYRSISPMLDTQTEANLDIYVMSVVIFLLGLVFTSFFFGNILALIMSWDQQSAQFRNRMDIISAEMKYYELPEELQHRVRRNYDYLWINQRAYSDMMLLNQPGISKTLRMTIALHLYKDLVKTVPFFAGSDARFLGKVCLALETAVYLPGDTIIYCDDFGKEMFIVRKGLVEILIPEEGNPDKRIYLRDGNFFGETALVIDVRRTNTVRAVNICDLNVLSKRAFNEIVAEYPEFGERMKRTVIKRQLDNMNIQSPVEKMKVQNQLNMVVEKSLKARRMSVSLRTIYRAKKLGDKLKDIADRAAKNNNARRVTQQLASLSPPSLRRPLVPDKNPQKPSAQGSGPRSPSQSSSHNGTPRTPRAPTIPQTSFAAIALANAPHHPPLHHQATSSSPRLGQIDAVSRKLSKTELTLDLIPAALAEITQMVDRIQKTTERLSRRLHHSEDSSQEEEEEEDDEDREGDDESEFDSYSDVGNLGKSSMNLPITSLPEEEEHEFARRERRSVYVPSAQVPTYVSREPPR